MTALDQAFIRAFTRQDTSPLAALPQASARPSSVGFEAVCAGPESDSSPDNSVRRAADVATAPSMVSRQTPRAAKPSPGAPHPTTGSPLAPPRVRLSATLDQAWPAHVPSSKTPEVVLQNAKPNTDVRTASAQCSRLVADGVDLGSFCFSATTIESPASTSAEQTPTLVPAVPPPSAPPLERRPATAERSPSLPMAALRGAGETRNQVAEGPSAEISPTLPRTPRAGESAPPSEPREFQPAWQVDHFTWPRVCRRLIARAAEELDRLADALLAAGARGQKVLGMTSCHRGEGATTLLLCAARRLAERGVKPVLMDADRVCPRLAKRLSLEPQLGWDETSDSEGKTLDQAIVEATTNNVAVLPVREPSSEADGAVGNPARMGPCVQLLREYYDIVLVDLGPLDELDLGDLSQSSRISATIDAVVLVHNDRITSEDQLSAMVEQLAAVGIAVAGIVENFVPEN